MPVTENNGGNQLTQRELQILEMVAEGKNHREVAEKLFISPETVRKHLSNIYIKLKVNNKIEAIIKVLK